MQIQTQENVVSVGFDIVAHLFMEHSIFYLQWISTSMILILNSRNTIQIIYTADTIGGECIQDHKSSDASTPLGNNPSSNQL